MLTVIILICSMATAHDDCTEKTAVRVIALPEHPAVCSLPAPEELLGRLADMIHEGEEYAKIECLNGRRV